MTDREEILARLDSVVDELLSLSKITHTFAGELSGELLKLSGEIHALAAAFADTARH